MYIPYIVSQHGAEISVQWTCSCVKLIEPPAWGGKQGTNAYVQPLFISLHLSHCISCLPTPGPTPLPPLTLFPAPALWRPFSFMELTKHELINWLRFSSLSLSSRFSRRRSKHWSQESLQTSNWVPFFLPFACWQPRSGPSALSSTEEQRKMKWIPFTGILPVGRRQKVSFLGVRQPIYVIFGL